MDPDVLFVYGAAQNRAKATCMSCQVRVECLADALDNRIEFGVWGGLTERERRALLRRRPQVRSWRRLLETARAEHQKIIAWASEEAYDREVTALYDQFNDAVYRFARKGLSHEEAEEVTNDAFLAARLHWQRLRETPSPQAYVFGAARNRKATLLKRYYAQPAYLPLDGIEAYRPDETTAGLADVHDRLSLSAQRVLAVSELVVVGVHVVRFFSVWSRTSAAATILPRRQGQPR